MFKIIMNTVFTMYVGVRDFVDRVESNTGTVRVEFGSVLLQMWYVTRTRVTQTKGSKL